GTLTILNSALNPYPSTSPFMSLTGDGSQSNILSAGNYLASNVDPVALAAADQTNPQGQISQIINSNAVGTDLPAITNQVVGAQPTPAFVENQLALLRTIDTTAAVAEPAGVTDVKLLRVFVSAGDNRTGVKIVGALAPVAPPTGVAPTVQVSIDHSDVNIATQTALVTFAFNEPISDFSILGSTTVTGGALSNLQTTDGGKTYTATFTPTANTDISNASVAVRAGSYHDLAGIAGTGGSTPLFTVDTVTPTVTVTTSN